MHGKNGHTVCRVSTSADLNVALAYSDRAEVRILFKVVTNSFMERGADLQYLSAFPGEVEYLYPPLTFLAPTGVQESVKTRDGVTFTVFEVKPAM